MNDLFPLLIGIVAALTFYLVLYDIRMRLTEKHYSRRAAEVKERLSFSDSPIQRALIREQFDSELNQMKFKLNNFLIWTYRQFFPNPLP